MGLELTTMVPLYNMDLPPELRTPHTYTQDTFICPKIPHFNFVYLTFPELRTPH